MVDSRTKDMVNNSELNNRTMELETHLVMICTLNKIKDITKATIWECSKINSNNLTNNRTPNYLVKAHSMHLVGNRISRSTKLLSRSRRPLTCSDNQSTLILKSFRKREDCFMHFKLKK